MRGRGTDENIYLGTNTSPRGELTSEGTRQDGDGPRDVQHLTMPRQELIEPSVDASDGPPGEAEENLFDGDDAERDPSNCSGPDQDTRIRSGTGKLAENVRVDKLPRGGRVAHRPPSGKPFFRSLR